MEASRALDRVEEMETRYQVEEERLAGHGRRVRLAARPAEGPGRPAPRRDRVPAQPCALHEGAWPAPTASSRSCRSRWGSGPSRAPRSRGWSSRASSRPSSAFPRRRRRTSRIGQPATIDTRNGIVRGKVRRIDPAVQNGTVTVDVSLEGEMPRGARPDLSVDGTIEVERLADVLHVGRPAYGQANSAVGLFKLDARRHGGDPGDRPPRPDLGEHGRDRSAGCRGATRSSSPTCRAGTAYDRVRVELSCGPWRGGSKCAQTHGRDHS